MAENTAKDLQNNPLLQRFFLTSEEKKNKNKGKAIVKAFYALQNSNATDLNYYAARKVKQEMLLQWAKGTQSQQEFLDYINVSDGNKAWMNMDMTPQRIAAWFVGVLVESMAKNKSYPSVDAIDDGSMSEKENRLFEALFRMKEAETVNAMQMEAGFQLEPEGAYVPDDELSAKVYFQLEDRLPKEIRFEQMLNSVMDAIQFEKVVNRKTLYDLIVLNTVVTKIEKIAPKEYTVRKCIVNNCIWNFFMNDTGTSEIDMFGEFWNLKVKDIRSKFGKCDERPDGMTEEEIFKLAKLSSNKNIGTFNYDWNNSYSATNYIGNRPYDDCSVLILDAEINCGEDIYYVSKKDAYGKENIQVKKSVPYQQTTKDGKTIQQEKPDNVEIIKKQKDTWMRGVYAPYGDMMLYWGQADLIINEYTNTSKPLSSYTINIPNNDGEYVPSLFERIMEPLREYSIVKLKRKQLISQIRPSGIRIDVETARNLDLGTGDSIPWEEVLRIFNQTGNEVWSSKGLDPLQREAPPISNTVQDTTVAKVVEMTNVLDSIRQEIRLLIGVPQYRDGSDVGDRTSGVLQKQQETAANNVTDFILNANKQVWEETDYKLCLLHWNDIVKEEPESKEDMLNTRFKVSVKMKSTEYQRELLERDIDRYSQVPDALGQPSLTLKDAMFIRNIDDDKLATWYLTKTYEENRRKAAEEQKAREDANIASQQESAKMASEGEMAVQAEKLKSEKEMELFKSTQAKELASVNGLWAAIGKGILTPDVAMPIIQQLIPNISISLSMENKVLSQTSEKQEEVMMEQENPEMQEQEQMEMEQEEQPQMM
jgi:hypothetical protein